MPARRRRAARCWPMKEKVLVIDDEEAIRKSLRMVLEYEGYEFLEAASGREGIEAVRRATPDAVLLDLKTVREAIARAAPAHATVLITGESGTGKELVAWEIHRLSPRAEKTFVKVNCAAIPEDLIESELFGHEKGSFTGATGRQIGKFVQADGGTIFLDEIGDMSPRTQAKVLRVLENGEVEPVGMAKTIRVDTRVIAATNKDLRERMGAAAFREDLFFRLNVVPIPCPPLRERREDIPPLIEYFVETFTGDSSYRPKRFAPGAVERLAARPWRGNGRELRNAVQRLLIMVEGDTIEAGDVDALAGEPMSAAGSDRDAASVPPAQSAPP